MKSSKCEGIMAYESTNSESMKATHAASISEPLETMTAIQSMIHGEMGG